MPDITGSPSIGGSNYWGNTPQGAFYKKSGDASNYIATWPSSQGRTGETYFSARYGETKTDGAIKSTTEHKVYGASDDVQIKNTTIRLWRRTA